MTSILAIGNSFSEDATCYFHQIAQASGKETFVVNLYIGGCSLERHWLNIESGEQVYQYQENGVKTERYVSIQEMLEERKWDYIVTQQSSFESGWKESYEPFLELVLKYLKEHAPEAEILLHETWAYEIDSSQPAFMRYHRDQEEMYRRLGACYYEMAAKYGLRLIPCGDVMQRIRQKKPFYVPEGGLSLCRDGQHVSFLYGRYLLACVWVKYLLQVTLKGNTYIPHMNEVEETADEELVSLIRDEVEYMISTEKM